MAFIDIQKAKILSCYEERSDNLEKGAMIGEVRHWQGGDYKKIASGKWVRVVGEKEKTVADSTMKKIISEERGLLNFSLKETQDEFKKKFKELNGDKEHDIRWRVKLASELDKDENISQARDVYRKNTRILEMI